MVNTNKGTHGDSTSWIDVLQKVLDEPLRDVRVLEEDDRLYSKISRVRATTVLGCHRDLIVKHFPTGPGFDRQIEALQRARSLFAVRDDVCVPYLGHDAACGILVMQEINDPSLDRILQFPRQFSRKLAIGQWRAQAEHACYDAGRWLREWHQAEPRREQLSNSLSAYLENRQEELETLEPNLRQRLKDTVHSLPIGYSCASHGDFTPPNVLWSAARLTILDFGISEWRHTSPAWDYTTMIIGLEQRLRFSGRCPARWLPFLRRKPLAAFKEGYGDRADFSLDTLIACRALRHFLMYAQNIQAGHGSQRKARWHYDQLLELM